MILSFYMDDTNPEIVKAEAYKYFLDYCYAYGIKGESSVILGYDGASLGTDPSDNEKLYLWLARQSYTTGIDSHMEIMTHNALFDFDLPDLMGAILFLLTPTGALATMVIMWYRRAVLSGNSSPRGKEACSFLFITTMLDAFHRSTNEKPLVVCMEDNKIASLVAFYCAM